VGVLRRVGDWETGEEGEDKLLGIEAFFIFRVFCKLEKLSFNLRLFHIINTSKFSRNS
jgi:hypothetical protein